MALKPQLPLADATFAAFKQGVEASRTETRKLAPLWQKNVAKTFGDIPKDYDDGDAVVNKDYSRVKQKASLLFFRVPEVQLKPLRPDAEPLAAVAAAALNQVLSREMQVSYMVDEVLTDAICPAGIGVSKIAYEAIMRPVQVKPPEHAQTPDEVFAGLVESGAAAYQEVQVPTYECYSWKRIPPTQWLYPPDRDGSNYDEDPWQGQVFEMSAVEAKRLYKLSDKDLAAAKAPKNGLERLSTDEDKEATVEKVQGIELWYRACFYDEKVAHKDHFRKLVYFPGMDKPVVHEDSPYQWYDKQGQLRGVRRYPFRVLSLTYAPDRAIPPSDVTITRPLVLELEQSRTLQMLQRQRSLPVRWFDVNQVDPTTEELLQEGNVQNWIPFQGPAANAIGEISRATYPRENFEFDRVIERDLSESWAIGAEQMGQSSPGEQTAQEVGERSSATQTRLDYERSKVLRYFREGAEVVFGLLQKFATDTKYAELVGDNGAKQLMAWNKQNLRGEFAFEARPDAALRIDAQADRQQALNIFSLLANDPLVNRRKLLMEVVRTHGMLPEEIIAPQPPEPQPERPNISFRFDSDSLDPTRPHALLVYDILAQTGMKLDPQMVAQAREIAANMLTMAAENPLLGLADTTRMDMRGNAPPIAGAPAAPMQPEHPGAVTPVPRLNKTVAEEGRTNQN